MVLHTLRRARPARRGIAAALLAFALVACSAGDEAPPPAPDQDPTVGVPPPITGGGSFSWTKPPGFDEQLAAAIAAQPSYAGGYGGQVPNPFPHLEGTTWFGGLQITRVDAVTLGEHFGRPSYRFFVDAGSLHSNGLRAEFTGAADHQYREGDTARYEFAVYFPAEYRNASWTEWNLFAQFHGPGFPAWGLHTAGGYLHMRAPDAEPNEYRIPMPAREAWHDVEWTIHWTPDSTRGWATLVLDGVEVFDYRGATMDATEPYYYPKFGAYLANNPYTQVTYSTPWTITRL